MEYRKVFDEIPEQFDKYRPRYSAELFTSLIQYAGIGPGVPVLEIGPGTGQATDPILETGCDYHAIELGEHLYAKMKDRPAHRLRGCARCAAGGAPGLEAGRNTRHDAHKR